MKVQIKRLDKSLPLPHYETQGSVGFDLLCRKSAAIQPREIKLIPANVIVRIPPGYMLIVVARSSLPLKKGLVLRNGVGIIDQDYQGPGDEIHLQLYNFTDKKVKVERGERLAQGIFVRIDRPQWEEVEEINAPTRGGFGSTD